MIRLFLSWRKAGRAGWGTCIACFVYYSTRIDTAPLMPRKMLVWSCDVDDAVRFDCMERDSCNGLPRQVVMNVECTSTCIRAEVESGHVLQADCGALMSMSNWLPHVESYNRDRFLLWEAEVPGND